MSEINRIADLAERQRDEATALVERLRGRVAELEAATETLMRTDWRGRTTPPALLSEPQASGGRDA